MTDRVDVVVIGGGAMGSAAAWQLAGRGRGVLLLERFAPGHVYGASHGASRNFNQAYSDPDYVAMLREASTLWRELEGESGEALLDVTGIANHGDNPAFDAVHAALAAAGIPAEFLPTEEAERRWPGIRFDSRVLFTPESGRLHADRSVAALKKAATARGAEVRFGARVTGVRVLGDDEVAIDYTESAGDGPSGAVVGTVPAPAGAVRTVIARRAVVTVGAWTTDLLAGIAQHPRLVVTQEQPAHFAVRDDSLTWPGFNHSPGRSGYDHWYSPVYGMFTPGEGVKAGWHGSGRVIHPDRRDFAAEPAQLAALRRYTREWLPGVDADRFVPISCTYTTTPDGNFVVDAVGPVSVGAGFSGHGFKFTPVVGRMLADLVDGRPAPSLFAMRRRRAAGV